MAMCIPCVGNIKHATLINNCYPVKEGGTLPRSSELSYLTFYASSRPAKLTKVGLFIQRKVTRDIRKGRKSYNLVSLHILKALIQSCHRDLNIFSKHVVKVLSMLLDTRDLEIIDLTCETFIVFCSYNDGSTLGFDNDLTADYESLEKKFAGFCNYTNEDDSLSTKMRYIGHRAIQASVSSGALQSSNFKTQLSILFPPLIITLASSNKAAGLDALNTSDGTIDIRESALNEDTKVDNHVIELLAAHTISLLFNKVTGPSVRLSLVPLFEYMNEKEKWWPPNLAVNIMKLVLDSLQPQYRYLLVSEILHQLDLHKGDDLVNDKNAALISILDTILNASIPLVGISVLEVLNSLFTLLIKTTQYHPFLPQQVEDDEQPITAAVEDEKNAQYADIIQNGLVHCSGGLASQTYYENQLNDITGYLISKLRPNTSLEYVDSMPIHDYRLIVLCCLDSVVNGSKQAILPNSSEAEIRIIGSTIPFDAWNPALTLLCDKNPLCRIAFGKSLYGFLDSVTPKVTSESTEKFPKHSLTHHHDAMFIDRLIHTMQDWILISDFNVTDLRFFYTFLCQLTRKFGIDATVMIVPLVFKIQQLVQEDKITLSVRQHAIESALISLFIMMGQFYHIESLLNYMNELKEERGARQDGVLLTESIDEKSIQEPELFPFTGVEEEETNPSTGVWIDRSQIVEIISKYGNLRDEQDTHGLELEAKLFAEWGSDAFLKNEQNIRSRFLQESSNNETKPRLASPWEQPQIERSPLKLEDRKDSIRVSHLKEALVAQLTDDDTDSTQSNSLTTHSLQQQQQHKPLPRFPPIQQQQADMNALFHELNLPQPHQSIRNAQSTVSLVNPPYKST